MDESLNTVMSPSSAKGGIKYEVLLEMPSNDTPPKIVRPLQSPSRQISVKDIENKLKIAEERRKSYEAQKINSAKERLSHVIEIRDKRNENEANKINASRQSLEKKMEVSKENRESHIKAIKEKQKEHVNLVETKRKLSLEIVLPDKEKLDNIQKKMAVAAELRDAKISALQERLREHDKHVAEVKKQVEDTQQINNELKVKLEHKLKNAQQNRDAVVKEITERLKMHKRHINLVNQKFQKNLLILESRCTLSHLGDRISKANEKRNMFLKSRQDRLKKHERKVLEVSKRKVIDSVGGNATE